MTAQELKNSILQLAVQGKLVPQCKDDEPASELLKQILAEKKKLGIKEKPLSEITKDEIPFDIPESWKWVKLGKIVSVISGTSYKSSNVCNNGIRILRGGNIQESKVLYFTDDVFLPEAFFDEEKSIKNGDILIVASTGSKAVIGKPGFVFKSDEKTQIGAFLRIVRPHSQQINDFIRIIFNSEFYRNHIRTKVQGMNINNVRTEHITEFIVPIPPLAEQKRIVEKIEELMPLIEEYGKAEEQLSKLNAEFPDKLRKSILQQAVQGKLTERDPADEPASELLKSIKAEKEVLIKSGKIKKEKPLPPISDDEKPFDIPDSWEWVRLGDLANKFTDGTHSTPKYTQTGIPFLSVKDMSKGYLDFTNTKFISREEHEVLYKRCNPEKGDLLITKVGTTGVPVIVNTDKQFSLFVSVALMKFSQQYLSVAFLINIINSPLVQEQAKENTRGVGNKNWVLDDIRNTIIPLPPLNEQKRIVKRVEELLALCDELKYNPLGE